MAANPTLSVSRVVAVSVSLTQAGAKAQSLKDLLLLADTPAIDPVERYRTYATLADVANDVGLMSPVYTAARAWFGQSPQPTQLLVGRWLQAASQGGLRAATLSQSQRAIASWQAITAGGFRYTKDGAGAVNVTGLNFSGAANLNAVAAIIQAALAGATCAWNASYGRFEFASTTTGSTSAFGFLTSPVSGVDISAMLGATAASSGAYVYGGSAPESAAAAAAFFDSLIGQKWYGLNMPQASDADHAAVALYIEGSGNKHVYGVTTDDPACLVASNTANVGYALASLNVRRTLWQWSSTSPDAVVSAMSRLLTVDYTGANTALTLKFKQEPGVTAEFLNGSQVDAIEANGGNVFAEYDNDTAIIEQGTMADGTFADIVTGTDWLAIEIQRTVYNLLYTGTTKLPQTEDGMGVLKAGVSQVCGQGVTNGLLAPGVWNNAGFGIVKQGDFLPQGYYVYSAPVATQNQALRAQRLAMPIQVMAKLAGAIHHSDIAVTVNQ